MLSACLSAAAVLWASEAGAQRPPAAPHGEAPALAQYELGRSHYAAGRYRAAAQALERAWQLDPRGTNLLFNLGTVYERMGDLARAQRAYQTYLARTDDAAEQDRTRRILTRLGGARLELAEGRRRRGLADGWFFATTGAALASTALGVTWLATQDNPGRIEPAPLAFTVGGVGLGVLATVLYFVRYAPAPGSFYE